MSELVRLSLSIEKPLFDRLEKMDKQSGYSNRSEFVRDMIRQQLVEHQWADDREVVGRLTIVYDADKSGSFIPLLTPSLEMERILITSTCENCFAYFSGNGEVSFSSFFWGQVSTGSTLYDAFAYSKGTVDPASDYRNALPHVCSLHLKDMKKTQKGWDFTQIGDGIVSYDNIFRELAREKKTLPMSIEHLFIYTAKRNLIVQRMEKAPELDQIRLSLEASYNYVKSFFNA